MSSANRWIEITKSLSFWGVAVGLSALLASQSSAAPGNSCASKTVEVGRQQTLHLDLNGTKMADTSDSVYAKIADLGSNLIPRIENGVNQLIGGEFQRVPEYRSHTTQITGPMVIAIKGRNEGSLADSSISFDQLRIDSYWVKTKKNWLFSISVRCTISIIAQSPTLEGKYDIESGEFSLGASKLNVQHAQDCSSSIGWIPLLGDIVDGFINRKAASYLENTIATYASGLPKEFYSGDFMGLSEVLVPGRFVSQGFDYGVFVRNQLKSLLSKSDVTVQLKARSSPGGRMISQESLFGLSSSGGGLNIDLTEVRFFDIVESRQKGCVLR